MTDSTAIAFFRGGLIFAGCLIAVGVVVLIVVAAMGDF